MVHDKDDPQCMGCKNKLLDVHLALNAWFWDMKKRYEDLHISWGFRDEKHQRADFKAGLSRLNWPNSKHNNMLDGSPCSLALDVFRIDQQTGAALFNSSFYTVLNEYSKSQGYNLRWGGEFKTLKDLDHFELIDG